MNKDPVDLTKAQRSCLKMLSKVTKFADARLLRTRDLFAAVDSKGTGLIDQRMMERAVTILDPYADDAKAQELQDDTNTIEGEHILMSEIMKCLLIEAVEENPVVRIEDIDLALRDYRLLVATSTHFMMKNDEDMTEIERDGYNLW